MCYNTRTYFVRKGSEREETKENCNKSKIDQPGRKRYWYRKFSGHIDNRNMKVLKDINMQLKESLRLVVTKQILEVEKRLMILTYKYKWWQKYERGFKRQ